MNPNTKNLTPRMLEAIEELRRWRGMQLGNNCLHGATVNALIRRGVFVCEDVNGGNLFSSTGGFVRITLAAGV